MGNDIFNKILSDNNNKEKKKTSQNILKIKFLDNISNDSQSFDSNNQFIVFQSINNILYLVYSSKYTSIILYDLINNKIINEIKKAHNEYISNFRHCYDKKDKRDLFLSISKADNNIKIWNVYNFQCIVDLKNIYNRDGCLYSACFLNDNDKIYIITSNAKYANNSLAESIKVYDLNGVIKKEIFDSNDNTFFIDNYYDIKLKKNYIITGNVDCVKSYDFNKNEIYHKYIDNNHSFNIRCYNIVIYNEEEKIKLIEAGYCYIRIWDFHLGILLSLYIPRMMKNK